MESPFQRALVLGAGNVGAWTARRLLDAGLSVTATTSNPQTARALTVLGARVLKWRWDSEASWRKLVETKAEVWCVTVPSRNGQAHAEEFHRQLHEAAHRAGVRRLIWTSSTAVYDPLQVGVIEETDAIHIASRHTGVDMLALERIHLEMGKVPFVALRFGGLFSEARHPALALTRRVPVRESDGQVQWVHEEDAARACAWVALKTGHVPEALNVVSPTVSSRREILEASLSTAEMPVLMEGGRRRQVSSERLAGLGFVWSVPDPVDWACRQAGVTATGGWQGPHGQLNWTRHASVVEKEVHGVALMIHGYKGFREWGNWKGVAERWAREGWEVWRMDFSHNGHLEPFREDCLDEEAWSQNRYHMERDEVAWALHKIARPGARLVVLGHSRGGAMAAAGARRFEEQGGTLDGVSLWAPVSDVFSRFPDEDGLRRWESTDRLEVVNGRTGQVLSHPFGFYSEAVKRRDELSVQRAVKGLEAPVVVVHGENDSAVSWREGQLISKWAKRGTLCLVPGADHVFGMRHPCEDSRVWAEALEEAWAHQKAWLQDLT
ncbi:MAG: alpha/beta fold hydrolase [Flavobacteriales bacterium]